MPNGLWMLHLKLEPKVLRLISGEDKIMQYATGKHCVYDHRYHLVCSTKYRFKVLQGRLRLRARDICRQVCAQNGVDIIKGVLSSDHFRMFVSVPPKRTISDLMRLIKGRSSFKIQQEFPQIKKRYWGRHFWGRGYFSATYDAITEDTVLQYLEQHNQNPTDQIGSRLAYKTS